MPDRHETDDQLSRQEQLLAKIRGHFDRLEAKLSTIEESMQSSPWMSEPDAPAESPTAGEPAEPTESVDLAEPTSSAESASPEPSPAAPRKPR